VWVFIKKRLYGYLMELMAIFLFVFPMLFVGKEDF